MLQSGKWSSAWTLLLSFLLRLGYSDTDGYLCYWLGYILDSHHFKSSFPEFLESVGGEVQYNNGGENSLHSLPFVGVSIQHRS